MNGDKTRNIVKTVTRHPPSSCQQSATECSLRCSPDACGAVLSHLPDNPLTHQPACLSTFGLLFPITLGEGLPSTPPLCIARGPPASAASAPELSLDQEGAGGRVTRKEQAAR